MAPLWSRITNESTSRAQSRAPNSVPALPVAHEVVEPVHVQFPGHDAVQRRAHAGQPRVGAVHGAEEGCRHRVQPGQHERLEQVLAGCLVELTFALVETPQQLLSGFPIEDGTGVPLVHTFEGVTERGMPQVVQEAEGHDGEPDLLAHVQALLVHIRDLRDFRQQQFPEACAGPLRGAVPGRLPGAAGEEHRAEGVLKPRTGGRRVHERRQRGLRDPSEPLDVARPTMGSSRAGRRT